MRATLGVEFAELGLLEYNGTLFMPVQIRRRLQKGELDERPATLRLPTATHRIKARVSARKWARDMQLEESDADLIAELENYWLLAFALRDPKPPFDQMYPDGQTLLAGIEQVSLRELWAKLDFFGDLLDPRYGELSDEEMWAVIERVAARGDPSPLAELGSLSQANCIAFMAKAASRLRKETSSSALPSSFNGA